MKTISGQSVFGGIAIGRLHYHDRREESIRRQKIEETGAELERFELARRQAIRELDELYQKAFDDVGEGNAQIFEIHKMMLEDEDYCGSIRDFIRYQKINAEFAVGMTSEKFKQMFEEMDDEYMQGRAADVADISDRLITILSGKDTKITITEPVIILSDDLTPSETIQFEKDKILGFVTAHGSKYSHTAILARMINIPAVIGAGAQITAGLHGKTAILDGESGNLILDPDTRTLASYQEKQRELIQERAALEQLKGKENVTRGGRYIDLYANISNPSDIPLALQNDAGGVGLFRSEFVYLGSTDYPTEEEQFEIYKNAVVRMTGQRIIIRTLDIGADKKIEYFDLPLEENPAMGYRAIRICLDREELFKTQLRAIYRASKYGKVSIMFPMIVSTDEVKRIKHLTEVVKTELRSAGVEYSEDLELGIMIETPAAAIISDELAKEVDFFSIGTNDLVQYTLACDRQNPRLDKVYDPHHEAVLRLIKTVADNAHKHGIWVGICGELAADTELTETFIKMGIDELSVPAPLVLPIRKKIREVK